MPAPRTITSANSVFMLSVTGLFAVPQALHGYSADTAFAASGVEVAETMMGVDGRMSAGWIPAPTKISMHLMADSLSIDLFEAWYSAQQARRELYWANGIIRLVGLDRSYECLNGVLSSYVPISEAAKTLRPRAFDITFESVIPGPF